MTLDHNYASVFFSALQQMSDGIIESGYQVQTIHPQPLKAPNIVQIVIKFPLDALNRVDRRESFLLHRNRTLPLATVLLRA